MIRDRGARLGCLELGFVLCGVGMDIEFYRKANGGFDFRGGGFGVLEALQRSLASQ